MDPSFGINRRYASLAIFVLAVLWIWVAFDRPYSFPSHIPWDIYSNTPQAPTRDLFDYPPLTSPAIKKVCANTHWNESVVFMCNEASGSIAEVRNSILSCVRYAMAAGGSLVIPRIVVREQYREIGVGNSTEMGYMFDTGHFLDSLGLSCPQLKVYKTAFNVQDGENAHGPILLQPDSLVKETSGAVESAAEIWRRLFYKWLTQYLAPDTRGPVIIQLRYSYLKYPIASDGEAFQQHFGKILKIRADSRDLATTILLKLSEFYGAAFDLKELMLENILLGAYLSTEEDVANLPIEDRINAKFSTQSKLYLDHAVHSNLSLIYVASEHGTDIPRFFQDASNMEIDVTSKLDLLKGKDREYLLDMTFDQQTLIDFLVMSKVSEFVGVGHSSFSWSVALRRHQYLKKEMDWLKGPQMANDPFSHIFGPLGGHPEFVASMWP